MSAAVLNRFEPKLPIAFEANRGQVASQTTHLAADRGWGFSCGAIHLPPAMSPLYYVEPAIRVSLVGGQERLHGDAEQGNAGCRELLSGRRDRLGRNAGSERMRCKAFGAGHTVEIRISRPAGRAHGSEGCSILHLRWMAVRNGSKRRLR